MGNQSRAYILIKWIKPIARASLLRAFLLISLCLFAATGTSHAEALITSHREGDYIRGIVEIRGNALVDPDDFNPFYGYSLSCQLPTGESKNIVYSEMEVDSGRLGIFDTTEVDGDGQPAYPDGRYVLVLDVNNRDIYYIHVIVDNVNEPPVFIYPNHRGAVIGRELKITIAYDPDDPEYPPLNPWGDLRCEYGQLPFGATVAPDPDDSSNYIFSWLPEEADDGVYDITFTATDESTGQAVTGNLKLTTATVEELFIGRVLGHDIYENRIVCTEGQGSNTSILMYTFDHETGDVGPPLEIARGYVRSPKIHGDIIVWQENSGTDYDILMYDISRQETREVAAGPGWQEKPLIYENVIAWQENSSPSNNTTIFVCAYDPASGTFGEPVVITDEGYSMPVAISGDKIIWHHRESIAGLAGAVHSGSIYMRTFDLSANPPALGSITQICDGTASVGAADIYNDKVVWKDIRDDRFGDIFLCNLSRGGTIRIAAGKNTQEDPAIYGNRIVWGEIAPYSNCYSGELFMCDYDRNTAELGPFLQLTNTAPFTHPWYPKIYRDCVMWRANSRTQANGAYVSKVTYATNPPPPCTYRINTWVSNSGTIDPEGPIFIKGGEDITFTMTPGYGYEIHEVVVDGQLVGPVSTYTFTNVRSDHSIIAMFRQKRYSIVASISPSGWVGWGYISPGGNSEIHHGGSRPFTITPLLGYHIKEVLIDGVSVGAVSSYTFTNVTADHTIEAVFEADELRSISGRVTLGDGSGLVNVYIRAVGNGIGKTAATDSNGYYIIEGLPNIQYTVLLYPDPNYTFTPDTRTFLMNGVDVKDADFTAVPIIFDPDPEPEPEPEFDPGPEPEPEVELEPYYDENYEIDYYDTVYAESEPEPGLEPYYEPEPGDEPGSEYCETYENDYYSYGEY